MPRLTKKLGVEGGKPYVVLADESKPWLEAYQDALRKLAAYEDLGSPDDLAIAVKFSNNMDQCLAVLDGCQIIGPAEYGVKQKDMTCSEEVYGQYTDTAGNFRWCGTHSGEHTVKAEEGEI